MNIFGTIFKFFLIISIAILLFFELMFLRQLTTVRVHIKLPYAKLLAGLNIFLIVLSIVLIYLIFNFS